MKSGQSDHRYAEDLVHCLRARGRALLVCTLLLLPSLARAQSSLVSISVTPKVTSVLVGNNVNYSATGVYSDSSTQDITSSVAWSSSNTNSATIDTGGLATGLGAQSSTIIKATIGAVSGSANLTVWSVPAPPSVTGTNGNDLLFFLGMVEQFNMTLTNAYSGASISINDTYNVNTVTYGGLGGTDTLLMTNIGDALVLDQGGTQTLSSVERIVAGDGNDIVDLSSTRFTLGDTFIDGGLGDDILWGNSGNDIINGSGGNDIIDGGPGNDIISGGDGNDVVDGGPGNDTVHGDAGDDTLIYTVAENVGNTDIYDGGTGTDTLEIRMTSAEAEDPSVEADIAAAKAFIAANSDPTSSTGPSYTFTSFGLLFSNIESLKIVVDGGLGFTTTALVSSTNPSTYGQNVTFTATVSPVNPGTPTGTLNFLEGTNPLGSALLSGGTTMLMTSSLTAGVHHLTTSYAGDSTFSPSDSAPLTQTVKQATSTTNVSSTLNPAVSGQAIDLSATVTPQFGSTPTGTVTFYDGATSLGAADLSTNVATLSGVTLGAGLHTITAAYGGDTNVLGSTSPAFAQTVSNAADTTAPVSSAQLSPLPNAQGWNSSNATVSISAADNAGGSGVKSITYSGTGAQAIASTTVNSASASILISTEGTTTISFHATDNAGNGESPYHTVAVKLDRTGPAFNCASPDGLWHATDVSLACSASDTLSGLAVAGDVSFSLSTSVGGNTENNNAGTNSRTVCDLAGNCAAAGPVAGNMVDKKPPSITITTPANSGSYLLNAAVASGYQCQDGGSGVQSCTGPVANGANVDTSSVGAKTFTVNAKDKVNNASSTSDSYTVLYAGGGICYGAAGHQILQPINADGSSVWKRGSTVPVKFRVCDANGVSIGTPGVVTGFKLIKIIAGTTTVVDETVVSTTPDTAFRWDATAQQWIFNISTAGLSANQTYVYEIDLNDGGSSIFFQFGLK